MNIDELTKILLELKEMIDSLEIEVSNELLFSKAVDVYIAEIEESNKDRRTAQIGEQRKQQGSNLATEKQKAFLRKNSIEPHETLTSKEAHTMIQELINKMQKKTNEKEFL